MSEDKIAWKRNTLRRLADNGDEEQIDAALRGWAVFGLKGVRGVFPEAQTGLQAGAPAGKRSKLRLVSSDTSRAG